MKPKSNYITPEQFRELIDYIPNLNIKKWKSEDIVMMFQICYWLGLRISEALRLKAEDLDLNGHEVYLGKTKTESEVYVKLPPLIEPDLVAWLFDKEGPLFPECNRFIVYYWLGKAGKALDITALTTPQSVTHENTKCHIFRKSIGKDMLYGTHTAGHKAPLNVVMKSLRHTNLDTTSKYLKVGNEDVKEWWDQNTPKEEPLDL
jgi:integrase